jgi:glycosyltransferase involved in cell wall biosynthesis
VPFSVGSVKKIWEVGGLVVLDNEIWLGQLIRKCWFCVTNLIAQPNNPKKTSDIHYQPDRALDYSAKNSLSADVMPTMVLRLTELRKKLRLSQVQINVAYSIFYAPYYIREAELKDNTTPHEAFIHFLELGILNGASPSPLFQSVEYERNLGEKLTKDTSPFLHWLTIGINRSVLPSARFNARYYLSLYRDVKDQGFDPFVHYLLHGMREGRIPTFICDTDRYRSWQRRLTEDKDQSYLRYLFIGYENELTSKQTQFEMTDGIEQNPGSVEYSARFDPILSALRMHKKKLETYQLQDLVVLFDLDKAELDQLQLVANYLNNKVPDKDDDDSFFQPNYYLHQLRTSKIWEQGTSPLFHWLEIGSKERLVPTENFDEQFYLHTYSDVESAGYWGFRHYIRFGRSEGRTPKKNSTFHRIQKPEIVLGFKSRAKYKNRHMNIKKHSNRILSSQNFLDISEKLRKIEPAIGEFSEYKNIIFAPLHTLGWYHSILQERLRLDHYDSILCVPWIKIGGADLVTLQSIKSLLRTRPGERILVIQTADESSEWKDVVSDAVDYINVSDVFRLVSEDNAARILRTVFIGLTAKRVINVNSRICWKVFQHYGKTLSASIDLFAFLFCWERSEFGGRSGYPVEFYSDTARYLKAIFTDNSYFKNDLLGVYRPTQEIGERVVILRSPNRFPIRLPTATSYAIQNSGKWTRPLILWAGRMDRQKRFDLVEEIAKLMPDVDFYCWTNISSKEIERQSPLPDNIQMKGSFQDYSQLPLDYCDGWLYTSEWDGIPTLLIELGGQGMSIVASAVEGVSELISEETGWPVNNWNVPNSYVLALRDMICSKNRRMLRSAALQNLVKERHSAEQFDAMLSEALK